VQPVLVKFIDHEPTNGIANFGYHPDTVALFQATEKVFIRPWVFETGGFNPLNFRHIATDHPANVRPRLLGSHGNSQSMQFHSTHSTIKCQNTGSARPALDPPNFPKSGFGAARFWQCLSPPRKNIAFCDTIQSAGLSFPPLQAAYAAFHAVETPHKTKGDNAL
jgi:hypothetical protein